MDINSPQFTNGLIRLFELFPVDVQAQLRAVCTWWKLHIEQTVWCNVRKIHIEHIDGNKYNIKLDESSCIVSRKNVSALTKRFMFFDHFPGVTSLDLKLYHKLATNERLLSHCLKQWTGNLTNLTLVLFPETSHKFQYSTWKQIDSMKLLKSVRLFLPKTRKEGATWTVPENLSILANLQELTLYCENDEIGALTQLGHNLRHLKLLFQLSSESIQTFKSAASKWILLQDLTITLSTFAEPFLLDLLTSLVQLDRLSNLCLKNVDWDQLISLITSSNELPILNSVNNLKITMSKLNKSTIPSHYMDQFDEHFYNCVPIMFPSLEKFQSNLSVVK